MAIRKGEAIVGTFELQNHPVVLVYDEVPFITHIQAPNLVVGAGVGGNIVGDSLAFLEKKNRITASPRHASQAPSHDHEFLILRYGKLKNVDKCSVYDFLGAQREALQGTPYENILDKGLRGISKDTPLSEKRSAVGGDK